MNRKSVLQERNTVENVYRWAFVIFLFCHHTIYRMLTLDDESADVVISSLRLGDDQGRCVFECFFVLISVL